MTAHHVAPVQEPWRPGSWAQARLSRFDTTLLTLLLAGIALLRAWDYGTPPPWVTGTPLVTPGLAVTEAAAPLWLWICWLGVGGIILGGAAVLRIHAGVCLGHALLALVYVGLAAGITVEYALRPWADGVRSAGPLWVIVVLHVILTLRTGWRPRA